MFMKKKLWEYVKWMLAEANDDSQEDLLVEPDDVEEADEEQQEVSSGGVAGATTPLGTDATYPNSRVGHKKSPARAAGDSFGGARPPKKS